MHRQLNRSRLVRLLGEWTQADLDPGDADLAERISLWLHAMDAVKLHTLQQAVKAAEAPPQARPHPARAQALEDEFERVRARLMAAVAEHPIDALRARFLDHPRLRSEKMPATDPEYAPFLQHYLDVQRQMDLRLDGLRVYLQQRLGDAAPRLAPLAVMDKGLEELMGGRLQKLLGTVPLRLRQHFDALRRADQDRQAGLTHTAASAHEHTAAARRPGGWMHVFGSHLQETLLAELELRLAPIHGLMEALRNEIETTRP